MDYSTTGSYGLQAGVQSFGYLMALMTDAAVEHVETSDGWELGVGPSIVLVDEGMATTLTTETAKSDVYAFTFGQKGLMAGLEYTFSNGIDLFGGYRAYGFDYED